MQVTKDLKRPAQMTDVIAVTVILVMVFNR